MKDLERILRLAKQAASIYLAHTPYNYFFTRREVYNEAISIAWIRSQEIDDDENFEKYLVNQTKLRLIDYYRAARRSETHKIQNIEYELRRKERLKHYIKADEKDSVEKWISPLIPRDREIMRLRFIEDLTFREIGEQVNLSESRAYIVFERRRKYLLDFWEHESDY